MSLKQPVSQVRLTNVAVVRLKHRGERFEIACYKNKVLNWREGIESDLNEVLQTFTVFHNVSKGQLAKKETLLSAFNTTDQSIICRHILERGELQISEKERQAFLSSTLQDIITVVIEMTVNVQTGLPLTRTAVYSVLRQVGFAVKFGIPAKVQALRAIELLHEKLPNEICRRGMLIRIICHISKKDAIYEVVIKRLNAIILQEQDEADLPNQDVSHIPLYQDDFSLKKNYEVEAYPNNDLEKELQEKRESENSNEFIHEMEPARSSQYVLLCVCPTGAYREIDMFVRSIGASLFLLNANYVHVSQMRKTQQQKYSAEESLVHSALNIAERCNPTVRKDGVTDVREEINDEISFKHSNIEESDTSKNISKFIEINEKLPEKELISPACLNFSTPGYDSRNTKCMDNSAVNFTQKNSCVKTTHCQTCRDIFDDVSDLRSHCRSERHRVNLLRKIEGLSPLTVTEFKEFELERELQNFVENGGSSKQSRKKRLNS